MWAHVQRAFLEALERAAVGAARIIPGFLVLLAVLLLFVLLAVTVRVSVTRVLRRVGLDRRAARWGFAEVQESLRGNSVSLLLGRLGFWAVVTAGLLVGLQVFEWTNAVAVQMLSYLPQIALAFVLLALGVVAARFFEQLALVGAVNLQVHSAHLVSVVVKWLVLVFAGALACEQLGIGRVLVPVAFGLLFGGFVLAAALAVGFGSRDVVRKLWEKRLDARRESPVAEVRHL